MTTIDINAIDHRDNALAEAAEGHLTTHRRDVAGEAERPSRDSVAAPERPPYCPSRMSAAYASSHMTIEEFLSKFPMAPGVEIDEASAVEWMDVKEAELSLAPTHRQDGTRIYHVALIDHRLAHLAAFGV